MSYLVGIALGNDICYNFGYILAVLYSIFKYFETMYCVHVLIFVSYLPTLCALYMNVKSIIIIILLIILVVVAVVMFFQYWTRASTQAIQHIFVQEKNFLICVLKSGDKCFLL